jgi:hypothetical protein
MRITAAGALILIAVSIPIAIELRTVFGFFGVDVPIVAIAILEVVFLVAVLVAYDLKLEIPPSRH